MRTRLSMKPTGWFQVGYSSEIALNEVRALRYFGQDLVAFRGRDGLHVLDAYCEHMGAHLGHGGCITDAGIRCPFHGWVWNGAGENVGIPYEERPNRAKRIRSWTAVERNGVIYLWHDTQGRKPLWEVPDLREVIGEEFRDREFATGAPDGQARFAATQVHPQYVIENIVDLQHFRFVHRTGVSPTLIEASRDEWTCHALVGFGKRWQDDAHRPTDKMNTIAIHFLGIGLGFNLEVTPQGINLILIATTPVDDDTCDVFGTYWLDRGEADAADPAHFELRLKRIEGALPDDIRIWDNQRYVERAPFGRSEAKAFRDLRRWTDRFYPDASEHTASEVDPIPSAD